MAVALDATVGLPGGVLHGRLLDRSSAAVSSPASSRTATVPDPAPSVLPPAEGRTDPSPSAVTAALTPILGDPAVRSALGASVVDVRTGAVLYAYQEAAGRPPASTVKLLTATAALERLGPAVRLSTTVVEGAGSRDGNGQVPEIVLVGGGDPSLRRTPGDGAPSLRVLASRTARALAERGTKRVRLAFDDSLFRGPTSSPGWPETYVSSGVVAPVTALSVDSGRAVDPSWQAAEAFVGELRRAGVEVRGAVRHSRAHQDAQQLAVVRSQPLPVLLEHMLTLSDNDYAEAFGHLVAVAAGEPATFAGGATATLDSLRELGLPTAGVRLYDASGLSRKDRVPPQTLTLALALAGSHGHPELSTILSGLAVAGFSGTLSDRFDRPGTSRGAGYVRGKTGTLTGIAALAGTVQDKDGQVLAFAFLVDPRSVGDALTAPAVFDRAATALARCGCSPD